VHETPEDLAALQQLLDESYASAGKHLLSIHTRKRRLSASRLAEMLTKVRVLALSTVSAKGEPISGPVDGLFYRGRFYFGSAPESVRFKHVRARPAVSAVHTVGEELAVTVHGVAREIDVRAAEHEGFLGYLREVYPEWDTWWPEPRTPAYAVIEARRMFAFWMPPASG
jgi:nitroimidazol reductase NimA-like FMN-containing flavoprotein (pyridoxamine 5'-phosphate oxidase superfamily)